MQQTGKLPLTIVTGFLGCGKTTLLSALLKKPALSRAAVIVNEFGRAGLDHRILRRVDEKTTLLGGGCVCCNIRADLVRELTNIQSARDRGELDCDRVVIETTGLADPAPIMFSVLTDPMLQHHYTIDAVISCVDAVNGMLHLDTTPESVKQIAVADKIILTKTDLAQADALPALREKIRAFNPAAQIFEAVYGDIDAQALLRTDALPPRDAPAALPAIPARRHGSEVRSVSIRFYEPLDWGAFGLWLSMLLFAHGEEIYRVKGMVDTGASGPVAINGVQHIIHPPQHFDSWGEEERRSEIVFIMRSIAPREILDSLRAFQGVLGAAAQIEEVDQAPGAERGEAR